MKMLNLLIALVLAPLAGASAQQQRPLSIEIISSFDYPGDGNSTSAQGINDQGNITGSYDDANGVTRGFIRYSDGSFSEPLVEPNDTDGYTFPRAINNFGTVTGTYGTADGEAYGFLLFGGVYTEFAVPNTVSTYIYGSNDSDDLVGVSYATNTSLGMAYARIGGVITTIDLPSVKTSFAYGINNAKEVVGLYYQRGDLHYHGFYQAPDGTLTAPINAPGAATTFLSDINEKGIIVGRYGDSAGAQHGLVFRMPRFFSSFDYPGATFTSVSGINNQGFVTGRYENGDGIFHSYLGKVKFGQ